ncbi:SAM-dependent chlorinase/fluorinase [Frankia sp. AiPs1]|uniref:SAM hydrolase/SAM-dependent halogenase family protein n=1 Tax=Frankia sp. AiPs1 TaxID=573493 RepID=UPI0020442D92|nr:SAM-dependent chlorinase/fluorinase [Frankia sp. AiPs1]MCM3925741.1 SAM-dependent chlorinase/fluorinase [Frankia sp. AiPs1]
MTFVSFTTDYGLADGFVAACHGVILRMVPTARIVDVTHLVPPGDVRRAAAVLAQTVDSLPRGVHLAVVDPGVGTARRAVAVRAAGGHLVGPDNGLLIAAAERLGGVEAAVTLPVPAAAPATFHGRDVFAPAAAELARGTELTALGAPLDPATLVRLPAPHARLRSDGVLEAEVLLVDTFGNVQLAAEGPLLAEAGLRPSGRALVWAATPDAGPSLGAAGGTSATELAVGVTFGSVAPGELVLYVDAAGMAAIAVRDGDAARTLAVAPADRLALCRAGASAAGASAAGAWA